MGNYGDEEKQCILFDPRFCTEDHWDTDNQLPTFPLHASVIKLEVASQCQVIQTAESLNMEASGLI